MITELVAISIGLVVLLGVAFFIFVVCKPRKTNEKSTLFQPTIDPFTGLPITPEGYHWFVSYNEKSKLFPYHLYLVQTSTGVEPTRMVYDRPPQADSIIYSGTSCTPAQLSTITPQDVHRTARDILKKWYKYHRTIEANRGFTDNLAGAYPPKSFKEST